MKPIYLTGNTLKNLNQHPKDSVIGKPGHGKTYYTSEDDPQK